MIHLRNLSIAFILLLASVVTVQAGATYPIPAGFAAYRDARPVKAVSPDGVVYRVRFESNKPYAELSFWKKALKKRMLDAGYVFKSDTDIKAGDKPGYLLELMAPVGDEDYIYLVAIFMKRSKKIVIVETAGAATRFVKHRDSVIAAISAIDF